jgi:hypothetical protein
MKYPLLAIVRRHTERGPDAAGATSENLLQRRPRRGQAAAPLAFSGSAQVGPPRCRCASRLQGQGLTAITPAATGCGGARGRRRLFSLWESGRGTPRPIRRPPQEPASSSPACARTRSRSSRGSRSVLHRGDRVRRVRGSGPALGLRSQPRLLPPPREPSMCERCEPSFLPRVSETATARLGRSEARVVHRRDNSCVKSATDLSRSGPPGPPSRRRR